MDTPDSAPTIDTLAQDLIRDLVREEQAIQSLNSHITAQLDALRSQKRELIEDLTLEASQDLNSLRGIRAERELHLKALVSLINRHLEDAPLDAGQDSTESPKISALVELLANVEHDAETCNELKNLGERIPAQAKEARERCMELAYSLQYALHIGHQFIEAIHGATSFPPMLVYTADGDKKTSASKRMMVNKVG